MSKEYVIEPLPNNRWRVMANGTEVGIYQSSQEALHALSRAINYNEERDQNASWWQRWLTSLLG